MSRRRDLSEPLDLTWLIFVAGLVLGLSAGAVAAPLGWLLLQRGRSMAKDKGVDPRTANGGRTAAVLISVCASCKRHGIDPWGYIRDLVVRVSTEPASNIRELLPDRWRAEHGAAHAQGSGPPSRAPPG